MIEKSGGIEVWIETLLEGKPTDPETAKFILMYAKLIKQGLEQIADARLSPDEQHGKHEMLKQANEAIKKYGKASDSR